MKKKLLVDVKAGLGNQLFQFSAAYAYAKRFDRELVIINHCDPEKSFSLDDYKQNFAVESNEYRRAFTSRAKLSSWLNKLKGVSVKVLDDPVLSVHQGLFIDHKEDILIMQGYWAFKTYFDEYKQELLSILNPKKSSKKEEPSINKNSVSLHIRRGDYTLQKHMDVFGILDIDYYKRSIIYLKDKIEDPRFYVFTNDNSFFIDQWKGELEMVTGSEIIVTNADYSAAEVIQYMRQCEHNVIANSTFSWWAAYLNSNPDKYVIQPRNWYNGSDYQKVYMENELLTDSGWVKL